MIKFKEGETVYIGQEEYIIARVDLEDRFDTFEIKHTINDIILWLSETEAQAFLRHAPYEVPGEYNLPDFSDAKAGDKCFCASDGWVFIEDVFFGRDYPIITNEDDYCVDGKFVESDTHPTLFHSFDEFMEYWKQLEGK